MIRTLLFLFFIVGFVSCSSSSIVLSEFGRAVKTVNKDPGESCTELGVVHWNNVGSFTKLNPSQIRIFLKNKTASLGGNLLRIDESKYSRAAGTAFRCADRKAPPAPPILTDSSGSVYFVSGNLGQSTATVSIPNNSDAPLRARYLAESRMGEECVVTLIKTMGQRGIVDSSRCSFEREFYPGQAFTPYSE